MEIIFTNSSTVEKIAKAAEKLPEMEQKSLLAQINATLMSLGIVKYQVVKKPIKMSMKEIDRIKHASRKMKYAK